MEPQVWEERHLFWKLVSDVRIRRALLYICREKNVQRLPVVSGSPSALLTKPRVPGKQGAEASRVCSTQSCGRDIAAFDKVDRYLLKSRTGSSKIPAGQKAKAQPPSSQVGRPGPCSFRIKGS